MKHKVGEEVRVKSLDWYNKNKDENWDIISCGFTKLMSEYCGMTATIRRVSDSYYKIDIDNGNFFWNENMFEDDKEKIEVRAKNSQKFKYGDDVLLEEFFFNDFKRKEDDMVNHPSHYTWLKDKCGIEVIEITRHLDFDLGNSIKYILRSGHKHDSIMNDKEKTIQDLEKAIFYLNDEISLIKNSN